MCLAGSRLARARQQARATPADPRAPAQHTAQKPPEAWYGTRTSSITRFLEASMGSQRDFSAGDANARAGKANGTKLLYELEWEDPTEAGVDAKPIKYW